MDGEFKVRDFTKTMFRVGDRVVAHWKDPYTGVPYNAEAQIRGITANQLRLFSYGTGGRFSINRSQYIRLEPLETMISGELGLDFPTVGEYEDA